MNTQKGRTMALLVALMICLSVAAHATVEEGTLLAAYMGDGARYISSFEFQEDTLYFIQGNNLCVLPEGAEDPKEYPLASIGGISGGDSLAGTWNLLKDQSQLYLLNGQEGVLYKLSLGGETPETQPLAQLNWDSYVMDAGNGQTYVNAPSVFCLSGELLYTLESDMNTRIVSFCLADGIKTTYETSGIEAMVAYKDGKLLTLSGGDLMQGTPAETISVFDPKEDALAPVGSLVGDNKQYSSVFGFCYDAERDTLFIGVGQSITRYDALGEGVVCALLPPAFTMADSLRLISADMCGVLTTGGILLRSLNPAALLEKESLTIQGDMYANALTKTATEMLDVNIVSGESQSDTPMIEQLISGSANVDIYSLGLQFYDFAAIRDKGYFADLAQSPKLKEHVDKFYPFIGEALRKDGQIAAIPSTAMLTGAYMYDTAFFDETGLAVPETFEEMCAIIADWPLEYQESYPQMLPVDMYEGIRRSLIRQAVDIYMNHLTVASQDMSFDTPLLRRLLTAAEETAAHYPTVMEDTGEYYMLLFSSREQLQLSDYRGSGRDSQVVKPLFLSVDEESTAPVALSLDVLLVNPHSVHKETSLRFLENVASNMDETTRIMLSPEGNMPLINPNFDTWLSGVKDAIAQTEKRIAETQGAEKREHEATLERQKASQLRMEQTDRYLVDEAALNAYREDIKGGFLLMSGMTSEIEKAVRDVRQRYADSQIDMEQFILEAEGKLKLILSEGN